MTTTPEIETATVEIRTLTVTALTTAAPGWTITIGSPRSGDQVTVPVVAWAAVTPGEGPADIYMRVEAVFVVDGSVWSTSDYREVFGYATEIHPPAGDAR